ncbi:MAG: hypothetical protein JST00_34445 [Deltaproteobacteria bacterium]|nr:hypothetical protein [Deltaproteobacteria bacterium]
MSRRSFAAFLGASSLLSLALASGEAARGEGSSRMPGPATQAYVRGARAELDASCMKCHATIAREHEASLHARSFRDPAFQRGYALEPEAFCRSCHAPEARPTAEPDELARSRGVACVTCHVPFGATSEAVLAGPSRRVTSTAAPHEIERVDDFGTRACAACHEFAFPGAEANGETGRMQKTMTEHAASRERDRSCASCHMPARADHAGHGVAVAADRALLAAALEVKVAREDDGRARFTLTSKGVGHAFPTGDLFRRLVLRVKTPRATVEHAFERRFRAQRDAKGVPVRFELSDSRPAPSRSVALPAPAGSTWEVVYQRITAVAQTPPFGATVESEVVLEKGIVGP